MAWSKFFRQFSVTLGLAIATALPLDAVRAESIFDPYKTAIREQIPVGLSIRLPAKILLSPDKQNAIDNFAVRVFVSQNPTRMTLSLHSCKTGVTPCLVGSFVTENQASKDAQAELARHQNSGVRITLREGVRGYVIDNAQQQGAASFATMMWAQDNMIHTLSFPQEERQNMLYMGLSMANSDAIFRP
ncbi:MAG: hypothetical protein HC799_10510 [Limnothrix sp. RL_2_0]|nr:hypothetical protein [Limnothrix sp. RL_2_0]